MDTQNPEVRTCTWAAARNRKGAWLKLPVLPSPRGVGRGFGYFFFRVRIGAAILILAGTIPASSQAAGQNDTNFRVGFTSSMFTDVNENDAKASIKVWSQTIAKERGIPINPDAMIIKDTPALLQALRDKAVDAVGITIPEYAAACQEVRLSPLFVTYTSGWMREEYLLLVHKDSQIEHLEDLRGKTLSFYQQPRTCLAQPWLDTLLVQNVGRATAEFLGKITQARQISKAVLPVFFRQSDACVATRAGFETMCELNPQVGHQLKIIACSPELVTVVLCFRADYSSVFKQDLLASLRELHTTAAGRQVLTVFGSDKLEEQPASCLASALELLDRNARLAGRAGASKGREPGELPQSFGGINP